MTERAQLHLVNAEGVAISPEIRAAVETAFRWVARDFPTLDEARLADWAEAVAGSMQTRGSGIHSLNKYAYSALRGKVRDWLRTGSAQEQSSGVTRNLERIGGITSSFQGAVDRKILFDQLHAVLNERDRDILVLLLKEKSAQDVAGELKTSYPAARKAIQRVKERVGAVLGSNPKEEVGNVRKPTAVNQGGLTVE